MAWGGEALGAYGKRKWEETDPDYTNDSSPAAAEGRSIYVRGIPPAWKVNDLNDFFTGQGQVETVTLLRGQGREQTAQAAFVDFQTREDATNASLICDKLQLDKPFEDYTLTCHIKHELARAWTEKRSVYVAGLPHSFADEEKVRELASPYGLIFDVRVLPANRTTLACFVVMSSPEEAKYLIESVDGTVVEGALLTAQYPRQPKGAADVGATGRVPTVEIGGLPPDVVDEDITGVVEASGHTPKRTRREGQVLLVELATAESANAVAQELSGVEFVPGYKLTTSLRGGAPPPSMPRAAPTPRAQGPPVGRLRVSASAYAPRDSH